MLYLWIMKKIYIYIALPNLYMEKDTDKILNLLYMEKDKKVT